MTTADQLGAIDHIVVLMLENRSFDHMLGFLYTDQGNVSPAGHPYEGLTGQESNPDPTGAQAPVFRIEPTTPGAYYMPGADPGEGFQATNQQLYGTTAPGTQPPGNHGFVTNFATTLTLRAQQGRSVYPGTTAHSIMGCFAPQTLPVMSALARGYAVCDHWYAPAPTETLPNRAFACAATSQGHMDDATHTFTVPSIFGLLSRNNLGWAVYGYSAQPLTRGNFPDIQAADASHFGVFTDFRKAAANGTLPAFTFLEPSWSSTGNSQHPNYDVALGEQLMHDVYYALRQGPGWDKTLLVITYDEHGGCYDHVPPPNGAVAPDGSPGEFGFDFTRYGVRVPALLVSPLIPAGTVFRVPDGTTPLDHTSVLRTVQRRWNLPCLTARDKAAPDVGAVLGLTAPRTDDPLAGVTVPTATGPNPAAGETSHLEQVHADLVARHLLPAPAPTGT
ncbi:alkaline phosphatase family protein [Kitasatospora aureofaciens]|uniref:alkaline phosphatase family protein n=1 Tax=Kitasatospora aureofaciens TaxID=1894 RepID=UPI001C444F52|nr:alkaline phosphatase family protein [Kitasatospora aureofaciens]MBV6699372.1 phosphoesterase [Kitasatospora aureofaciens]